MPDKMNLDDLKLLYCEFHKYEVMTMSLVGAQPKNTRKSQLWSHKTHRTYFSNLRLFLAIFFLSLPVAPLILLSGVFDWLVGWLIDCCCWFILRQYLPLELKVKFHCVMFGYLTMVGFVWRSLRYVLDKLDQLIRQKLLARRLTDNRGQIRVTFNQQVKQQHHNCLSCD